MLNIQQLTCYCNVVLSFLPDACVFVTAAECASTAPNSLNCGNWQRYHWAELAAYGPMRAATKWCKSGPWIRSHSLAQFTSMCGRSQFYLAELQPDGDTEHLPHTFPKQSSRPKPGCRPLGPVPWAFRDGYAGITRQQAAGCMWSMMRFFCIVDDSVNFVSNSINTTSSCYRCYS